MIDHVWSSLCCSSQKFEDPAEGEEALKAKFKAIRCVHFAAISFLRGDPGAVPVGLVIWPGGRSGQGQGHLVRLSTLPVVLQRCKRCWCI